MKEILLVKNGEIALKGLNRRSFEDALVSNISAALSPLGAVNIKKAQSTIFVSPDCDDFDMHAAVKRMKKVFGIAAFSRAAVCEKDMERITTAAADYLSEQLYAADSFKVEAKRSDKKFPFTSPEICAITGEKLLSRFGHLRVDVHNPQITVTVEIRDFGAYIHANQLVGAGGMPVGTGGKAMILISGGIDSPVAAYMLAKRGVQLTAVHFASPPYTGERAEMKVIELLKTVCGFAGKIKLLIVPFTRIQEQIAKLCPNELSTLIMRRYMMRISSILAEQNGCDALITGESIGQVASQTMKALCVTEDAAKVPVFRPLIGMDKEEIIRISRKIGTFDISVLPYEDCCTVFTPRHPKTQPRLDAVADAEKALMLSELIDEAVSGCRKLYLSAD